MPYSVRKVNNKNCWTVKNRRTGVVHAKCSTRSNAMKQMRLLYLIERRKRQRR